MKMGREGEREEQMEDDDAFMFGTELNWTTTTTMLTQQEETFTHYARYVPLIRLIIHFQ